jgi:predicted phosphodiesterase
MRFLCISDIHGHADKLARVLEQCRDREFNQLIVCGDLLFPGPDPLRTWKLLTENHALCVQGLTDKAVALVDPDLMVAETAEQEARLERLRSMHSELGQLIVARLARLNTEIRLPLESGQEMLIVHGSPADPTEPLGAEMDDEEINALLGDDPADLVVCGGSHVPFERMIGDVRIVNVGSVGECPTEGIAHATLIESSPLGITVDQFHIDL